MKTKIYQQNQQFYCGDIYKNLPAEIYHSQKNFLSKSQLDLFAKAPALIFTEKKQTSFMSFGEAFHKFTLERESFFEEFAVSESSDRRSAAYKKTRTEHPTKKILTLDDFQKIERMAEKITSNPTIKKLWNKPHQKELSFFGELDGIPVKCRFDFITEDGWAIDFKKCQDASEEGVQKATVNYNYQLQAVFYQRVYESVLKQPLKGFIFAFVEENSPHLHSLFALESGSFEIAQGQLDHLLKKYQHCKKTNNFHGYVEDIQILSLPVWFANKIEGLQS